MLKAYNTLDMFIMVTKYNTSVHNYKVSIGYKFL